MVAVRRGILVFGCAVAFAAAPLMVASPAAADCPSGTVPTHFAGVCIQGQDGEQNAPSNATAPLPGSAPGANTVNNPNGVGSVNGIPCTPQHLGTCIGMQQGQG